MNNNQRINKLKQISDYVRTTALGTILNANNGHVGGNLSSVELLVGLYFGGLFNPICCMQVYTGIFQRRSRKRNLGNYFYSTDYFTGDSFLLVYKSLGKKEGDAE